MTRKTKKKRGPFSQLPSKKPAGNFSEADLKVREDKAQALPEVNLAEPSMAALRQLFASGQRAAFLSMLQQVSLQDPENVADLPELGNQLMRVQDFDSAATVFRAWSEAQPASAKAFNSLGTALISGNWLDAGQAALLRAVALEPRESIYQLNLAKLYMVRSMWQEGKSVLMNLRHSNPQSKDKVDELLAQFPAEGGSAALAAGNYQPVENIAAPAMPAAALKLARETAPAPPLKMLLCCQPGMDNFVNDFIEGLKPQIAITKKVSADYGELINSIKEYEHIWLEWGNEQAIHLTSHHADLLRGKRVILRVHSYEAFNGDVTKINYQVVDDLIFVAGHIKDICLRLQPRMAREVKRIHILPNGVDMAKFALSPDKAVNKNIAFAGYINFKKDPMTLLQSFYYLHRLDPQLRLHIAGEFQDLRIQLAFDHFLNNNKLHDKVIRHGWQKDMQTWFRDKTYTVLSSLMEGHPVGVLEAIACGLQPLIYNFLGADAIYPREFLWSNFLELGELMRAWPEPARYRRFVEQNYSLAIQLESLRRIISQQQIVEPGPILW